MLIRKINTVNFGAMPDLNTRAILKCANMKGIDTTALEDVMKEVYADKYIITNEKGNGIMTVALCDKEDGVAQLVRPVMKFNRYTDSVKLVIKGLTQAMARIKKERTPEQQIIDRIENKFGRYDDGSEYKYARNYVA